MHVFSDCIQSHHQQVHHSIHCIRRYCGDVGNNTLLCCGWESMTVRHFQCEVSPIHKFRLWCHWLANAAWDSNTGQTIANFRTSYSRMDWRNKKHVRTKLFRDKTCVRHPCGSAPLCAKYVAQTYVYLQILYTCGHLTPNSVYITRTELGIKCLLVYLQV